MSAEVDDFLAHHGVKGMRWGVRKERDSGSRSGRSKPKTSRKEYRAQVKKERTAFYQNKADKVLDEAIKKGADVLVSVKGFDTYPTVMTGKEFTTYLSKGGVMDIKYTDIFARKEGDTSQYVLNDKMNTQYRKPKRS